MNKYLFVLLMAGVCCSLPAQTAGSQSTVSPQRSAGVRGVVKDDTGGIIPGATVTLTAGDGTKQTTSTGADGMYSFKNVLPGNYTVLVAYTGLGAPPVKVTVGPSQSTVANLVMTVAATKQEVTVSDTVTNQVSTEAANNSSALVLQKEDLDALPDDPDDLQADLQALAGPSAGPGGTQIFVDGFTGGRLPPKETIREIRINSNPFSAEFDKLGYGRIQIFTKPGSDKFHGQAYYDISDDVWNSRNPFLSYNPYFRTQLFGGNVSGPLGKKASFFIDTERRNIDDNGIVTASIPLPNFTGSQSFQQAYSTPQRRTTVSPRVDIQLNSNNTLSFRYSYLENDRLLTNIGAFNVPQLQVGGVTLGSNGYSESSGEHLFQMVDTAVLSTHVVNETHFEFSRDDTSMASSSLSPELNVGQSFVSGGSGYTSSQYPQNYDNESYYELQNYSTVTWGTHTTKFGGRIRATTLADLSPRGFNGTYDFLGSGPQSLSIDQYLMTERLLAQGLTPAQVTAAGYGPSKFVIDQGNPYVSFYQLDFGPFVQDDWRVAPGLTVSLGLRWESQTNINDNNDWAPRVGFAWAPGAHGSNSRPKTVIRGGWGFFYDRFAIDNVLEAYRSNQVQQYSIDNPTFYNAEFSPATIPSLSAGSAQRYIVDSGLKAPRLMQTVIGMDRQLFSKTTLSINFMNSRGTHELLTDDINAPIPIPGDLPPGFSDSGTGNSLGNTIRPFAGQGDIYDYQSAGIFKQTQVLVSVNSRAGKWLTLFSRYSYADAHSDADSLGGMPSNPYNIAQDWGRSALDIHHTLFLGGSIAAPWGLRFSPFLVARTGTPFNITTGTDLYLEGAGAPTARPELVSNSFPGAIATPFGYLNPNPLVGAPVIERNIATGPGFLGLNLRLSKTFGFGSTSFKGTVGGARASNGGYGGGGGHGGGGGGWGMGGAEYTEHRYNLVLSVNARNILNHENLNTPNGALTSPYFLQSTGITGGFGAESTASNQRRIDIQLRFAF